MIVVTGAAGFIGSCLVHALSRLLYDEIVAVDDFSKTYKDPNLSSLPSVMRIERDVFPQWLEAHGSRVQFVFHLGARTDTAEFDTALLNRLNLHYSQKIWDLCVRFSIPWVYASSAATYGLGEHGFSDQTHPSILKPLNPYGVSKNDFDLWVLEQKTAPPFWAGFKFFNVFGPNEYHKGRMASVILHAYNQIQQSGEVKLFQSHRPDYEHGMQQRDFVYIKDVIQVLLFAMEHRQQSGIYNLGSGEANTFNTLVESVFEALERAPQITYIPTPEDIRDTYQYYTCARMDKLISWGYSGGFTPFKEAVMDYTVHYLKKRQYFI